MTREEAIEQLQNCKELILQDGKDWLDERDIPLIDMAISALSAEQVTGKLKSVEISTDKCDESTMSQPNGKLDLISRAEAKAEIRKRFPNLIDRIEINTVLNELPSVSADRPGGEWVDWLGKGNEWECSVCKCSIESHGSIAYRYCPMCGAKMKGGAE